MACIPTGEPCSVGPVRSTGAVRQQLLHAYSREKRWTLDAGVASRVQSLDLRANAWLLWQNWLQAHPQVNAVHVDARDEDSQLAPPALFWDHWPFSPGDDSDDGRARFTTKKDDVQESVRAAARSLTATAYDDLALPESPFGRSATQSALTEYLVSSRVGALEMKLRDYFCRGFPTGVPSGTC